MSYETDPRPGATETRQPVDEPPEYKTPFERAQEAFAAADTFEGRIDRTGLSNKDAALLGYGAAQVEMMNAMHEVLERIERSMPRQPAAQPEPKTDASALLQQLSDRRYQQYRDQQGGNG